jgi:predicted nicotinamide N-methyase
VTSSTGHALADIKRKIAPPGDAGLDGLRLTAVPFVPEVRLHLAEDSIVWWARMEAEAGRRLAAPFWASAWAGGQAVARYILDNPDQVAGRRVLDVASGSGLVAIAARLAGAAAVTANDIDPYALAAVTLNANVNRVSVARRQGDLLDGDGGDADVVLAGDVFYTRAMAERVQPFLARAMARGAKVLVGDPGRAYLPTAGLETVASYEVPMADAFPDAEVTRVSVLQPCAPVQTGPCRVSER